MSDRYRKMWIVTVNIHSIFVKEDENGETLLSSVPNSQLSKILQENEVVAEMFDSYEDALVERERLSG